MEQVCQRAQQVVILMGPFLAGLILMRPAGPIYRNERPALIRQDQQGVARLSLFKPFFKQLVEEPVAQAPPHLEPIVPN